MAGQRSVAWPLSGVAIALVAYATLYPLSGWHWPDPQVFSWVLPKLGHEAATDLAGNILGYVPLGFILCLAHLRVARGALLAGLLTVLGCSALSYALELIQFAVPSRIPSMSDWVLNTLGSAWGVLAALTLQALGVVDAWARLVQRWFRSSSSWGPALLWVWPLGLLYPPPVPLGQGQVWPPLRLLWLEWTQDVSWQGWLLPDDPILIWSQTHAAWLGTPWRTVFESAVVGLGQWAPLCVVCALVAQRSWRLGLMAALVVAGMGVSTLSSALNYGPPQALTWLTLPSCLGLLLGALGGVVLLRCSRRLSAALGLVALGALVVLIHLAPTDPYQAANLAQWTQGRFIRFHGLARWVGLLWPYLAMVWLLAHLWRRRAELGAPTQVPTSGPDGGTGLE
ncbi:VanZ family protein [Aquabacterium sp. A3]|uniref:VanZ family protein n=1 Tax=Aquabacterium sp. A3 TaxID=3132829 RepID=UPI003119F8B0